MVRAEDEVRKQRDALRFQSLTYSVTVCPTLPCSHVPSLFLSLMTCGWMSISIRTLTQTHTRKALTDKKAQIHFQLGWMSFSLLAHIIGSCQEKKKERGTERERERKRTKERYWHVRSVYKWLISTHSHAVVKKMLRIYRPGIKNVWETKLAMTNSKEEQKNCHVRRRSRRLG